MTPAWTRAPGPANAWQWSCDTHHPTALPEGAPGAERALRAALADADLCPFDIDHVNAHRVRHRLRHHKGPSSAGACRRESLLRIRRTQCRSHLHSPLTSAPAECRTHPERPGAGQLYRSPAQRRQVRSRGASGSVSLQVAIRSVAGRSASGAARPPGRSRATAKR
ncbi:hypothetical protein J7E89_35955 [Streptomyces sp. ISL-100]|nr:hypothetical protein [Streptomyces sp. ISL-100]